MKRMFKKNQIIIAVLAVMIATAGYLNYSGRIFGRESTAKTNAETSSKELLDISEGDIAGETGDIDSPEEGEVEGTPGEAVLTSGEASGMMAEAKISREQIRAKNKELLMEIIDNEQLAEEQKGEAVAQVVQMTTLSEKEVAAETMLASKGYTDTVVSITEDSADVIVSGIEMDDAKLAQIEDIVSRKTGVMPEKIIISPVSE